MSEPGTLALVGAGEFLPSMRAVDGELLRRAGGRRVVILPTASAPDGLRVVERWAAMGAAHFSALGAEARAGMALDRTGCESVELAAQVRDADLVYISGGKPAHLVMALRDTAVWEAILAVLERDGALAGCSAGAMVLGGWVPGRPRLFPPRLWQPGLGLVPQTAILPHFDEIPALVTSSLTAFAPRGATVIGVDGGTALVGRGSEWTVLGQGSVRIQARDRDENLRPGDRLRL